MNDGNKYITPLIINVPADVEYFLKECDDNDFDLYDIFNAIRSEQTKMSINGVNAILTYESVTHF